MYVLQNFYTKAICLADIVTQETPFKSKLIYYHFKSWHIVVIHCSVVTISTNPKVKSPNEFPTQVNSKDNNDYAFR